MNSEQYCQRAELTHEEQAELYMKLPKEKLVEMLIECNRVITLLTTHAFIPEQNPVEPEFVQFVNDNFWELLK